jgi:dUTP pyrophosphatase
VIRIKKLRPGARMPERATEHATGFDLYACLEDGPLEIGETPVRVPTGVAMEAPPGYDVQIRPRSGLSFQGVMTTYGTIDADYRGELLVTIYVLPYRGSHTINDGDRIAQLIISRFEIVDIEEVEELSDTVRGAGGHGSTGR